METTAPSDKMSTLGVYRYWRKCKALFLMRYALDFIEDNTVAGWSSIIGTLWYARRGVEVVRQDAWKTDRRRRGGIEQLREALRESAGKQLIPLDKKKPVPGQTLYFQKVFLGPVSRNLNFFFGGLNEDITFLYLFLPYLLLQFWQVNLIILF